MSYDYQPNMERLLYNQAIYNGHSFHYDKCNQYFHQQDQATTNHSHYKNCPQLCKMYSVAELPGTTIVKNILCLLVKNISFEITQ